MGTCLQECDLYVLRSSTYKMMEVIVLMFLHFYIASCWPISVSYVLFCSLFCSVLFIAGEAENVEDRVIGREFSRLP